MRKCFLKDKWIKGFRCSSNSSLSESLFISSIPRINPKFASLIKSIKDKPEPKYSKVIEITNSCLA